MRSLTYTVTGDDYLAYQLHRIDTAQERLRERLRLMCFVLAILWIAGAIGLAVGLMRGMDVWGAVPVFGACLAAMAVLSWFTAVPIQRLALEARARDLSASNTFLGPRQMEAAPEALYSKGASVQSVIAWQAVQRLDETPDHLFVVLGSMQEVYVVPKRGLAPEAFAAFKADIEAGIRNARR